MATTSNNNSTSMSAATLTQTSATTNDLANVGKGYFAAWVILTSVLCLLLALTALGIYAYIMFIRPARQKFHDDEVKGETRPSDVTPNSAKFMVSAVITGIDSILSEQIKQQNIKLLLALTALGIYAYIMFIRPARQKFHDDEVKGETRPSDVTPNSAKFMVSAVITGIDSILSEQIKQHISAHKASTPNSRKNSALTKEEVESRASNVIHQIIGVSSEAHTKTRGSTESPPKLSKTPQYFNKTNRWLDDQMKSKKDFSVSSMTMLTQNSTANMTKKEVQDTLHIIASVLEVSGLAPSKHGFSRTAASISKDITSKDLPSQLKNNVRLSQEQIQAREDIRGYILQQAKELARGSRDREAALKAQASEGEGPHRKDARESLDIKQARVSGMGEALGVGQTTYQTTGQHPHIAWAPMEKNQSTLPTPYIAWGPATASHPSGLPHTSMTGPFAGYEGKSPYIARGPAISSPMAFCQPSMVTTYIQHPAKISGYGSSSLERSTVNTSKVHSSSTSLKKKRLKRRPKKPAESQPNIKSVMSDATGPQVARLEESSPPWKAHTAVVDGGSFPWTQGGGNMLKAHASNPDINLAAFVNPQDLSCPVAVDSDETLQMKAAPPKESTKQSKEDKTGGSLAPTDSPKSAASYNIGVGSRRPSMERLNVAISERKRRSANSSMGRIRHNVPRYDHGHT